MSKLETNQVDPSTGTTLTLGTSGDTIAIPSGVTIANSGTATGFGGTNTPAFAAHLASDQSSLSDNSFTKIAMATEFFDSDGKYDTSNYRFTPTVAGKYMFGVSVYLDATNTMETTSLAFYKNGSNLLRKDQDSDNSTDNQLTGVIELDTDDYVELYGKVNVASGGTWQVNMNGTTSNNRTYWYGYKLII